MKINHLLRIVPAFALGLALVACSKEDVYTPAEPEDASKTYVGADMTAERSLSVDGSDIVVPFVRSSSTGDLEVSVKLNDPSGLFSLSSPTVKFVNGETKANVLVSYSYDDLEMEKIYDFSVEIAEEFASQYRAAAMPISCKKAWKNLGVAQFYDAWWFGFVLEKQLLQSPDGSATYRLLNPWDKASVEEAGLTFSSEVPYFEFSVDAEGQITYSRQNMGFSFSGMTCHMLYPSDVASLAPKAADNVMLTKDLAQFCWVPVLNYNPSSKSYSWWGQEAYAIISFPGGPDLNEIL